MGSREGGQTHGAGHVGLGQSRWSDTRGQSCGSGKMGPRAEKGSGSPGLSSRRQGLPAGRGPTNVTVAELAPGLADPVQSKTLLLQWASRRWVEGLLTFERRAVKKATSKSEKVIQHPSLTSVFCDLCSLFIPPSSTYTQSLTSLPCPATHCLEGPHVAHAVLSQRIPLVSVQRELSGGATPSTPLWFRLYGNCPGPTQLPHQC